MKTPMIYLKGALRGFLFLTAILLMTSCDDNDPSNAPAADSTSVAVGKNDDKFITEKKELDAQFIVKAASINLEEMKLGLLAQQLSKSDDVKALGTMMEADHAKSFDQVRALAAKKQITIPTEVSHESQEVYDKLNAAQLTEFDRLYCDLMVKSHNEAIELFERAALGSYDQEIKEWANVQLAILRNHLGHSQSVLEKTAMFIPEH